MLKDHPDIEFLHQPHQETRFSPDASYPTILRLPETPRVRPMPYGAVRSQIGANETACFPDAASHEETLSRFRARNKNKGCTFIRL